VGGNALYARVSSAEQRARETIQTQVQFAERFADLRGLTFAAHFLDDGVTGTKALEARPGGKGLLEAARAGQVSTVYLYRLDRLGRDIRVILNAVYDLEALGCAVVSMTESFETVTPAGKAMLGMLSVFAGFDRDSQQARFAEGKERCFREPARWTGGPRPPYGYAVEGERQTARLVLHETEAESVRLIFSLCVERRWSCRQIAAHLNELDVPTPFRGLSHLHWKTGRPTGGLWTGEQVARILHNTSYYGTRYYNKRSRREVIAQEVPALIPRETWDLAQIRLQALQRPRTRPGQRFYTLRGLLRCGECGLNYHGWPHSAGHFYYVCHGKKKTPKCGGPLLNAVKIEAAVWVEVEVELAKLETAEASFRRQGEVRETRNREREERQVVEALEKCGRARERVLTLYRKERISESDLDQQLAAVEAEEVSLRSRLAELRQAAPPPPLDRRALLAEIRAILAEGVSPERQAAVLALLIERIVVGSKSEGVEIVWRV
jgi:site-specific DNA recombinase